MAPARSVSALIYGDEAARAEGVAAVFRTVDHGVLAAAAASIVLASVLYSLGETTAIKATLFTLYIGACAAAHVVLHAAYRRVGARAAPRHAWGWAFTLLSLLEGVGWGWSPIGLSDGSYDTDLLCLVATLGIVGGSIVAFSPYLPAFLAFFLPATLPSTVHLALGAKPLQQGSSILMLVYVVGIAVLGFLNNRSFRRLVELRLHAEALAADLGVQIELADAANRAKSSFLAAASHDLRQPVHALGLFIGALRGMPMSEDAMLIVRRIEGSAQALDSLFTALLDISRLDAGTVAVERKAFSIAPLLERIVRDQAPDAGEKGIEVVVHPSSAILYSDPILIERILRNLLSNAVRYTRAGRVVVGCRRQGALVRVEVWDTGEGIPADQRERIFQEYYQIGNSERDRAKGLGLGLAIVRRLVSLLDCELTLRSVVGRGSCFAITIPRVGVAALAGERESEAEPQVLKRQTIVVVDDEADIRAGMATLLSRWGHDVIVAGSGSEAMEQLADCPVRPDMIISDFRLRNGETGLDVIEALRVEYNARIPAILITGDTAPERLIEARDSGLLLVHKPVSNSRLRAAIANTIAGSAESVSDPGVSDQGVPDQVASNQAG